MLPPALHTYRNFGRPLNTQPLTPFRYATDILRNKKAAAN